MARCFRGFVLLMAVSAVGILSQAQPAAAPIEQVHLGDSVVALNGPWKFTIGDSLINPATGKPFWAEPGFDDSRWETVDLTPSGAVDPISGLSDFVPGWTARGHRGYWGYAWYRIHVHVETKPGVKLAIAGPSNVDDAYQAFFNGSLVGSFGDFSSARPMIYYTQPVMLTLPDASGDRAAGQNSANGDGQVIAFRFWMEANTLFQGNEVGGMHTAPLLGQAGAVMARHQMRWLELIRSYILSPIQAFVFGLLGVVACSLMLFDRSDRVYLWIGMILLTSSVSYTVQAVGSWTEWIGALPLTIFTDVIIVPLTYAGWVMVWRVWFRLRKPTWMPWLLAALVVLLMFSNALGDNIFYNFVSQPVSHAFHLIAIVVRVVLAFLMLTNVFLGIRKQGRESWLVLPAVLAIAVNLFVAELHLQVPLWIPFGIAITVLDLENLLLVVVLGLLMLRRLMSSLKSQRQMALDVKQAQEVQQVILPEAAPRCRAWLSRASIGPRAKSAATSSRSFPTRQTAVC